MTISQQSPQLIVVANRAPFRHEWGADGRPVARRVPGGLVHAVEPLMRANGGVWVAQGQGSADRAATEFRDGLRVPAEDPRYRLRRVWLEPDEVRGYYDGFANEALWPLCHQVHTRPIFRPADFEAYWTVNSRFAWAVHEEAVDERPIVFVQDYHLALAPMFIRERLPQSTIAAFWHIPWPHWRSFEICPWSRQLVLGMLESNLVGFQTPTDCANFLETAERVLHVGADHDEQAIAAGLGQLREHERAAQFGMRFEQPLDCEQLLLDALGVVEPIDTHHEPRLGRQPQFAEHALATDTDRRGPFGDRMRPGDRCGIRPHDDAAAVVIDRCLLYTSPSPRDS